MSEKLGRSNLKKILHLDIKQSNKDKNWLDPGHNKNCKIAVYTKKYNVKQLN